MQGRERIDRPARPQPSLVLVPRRSGAPGVLDREPGRARQVQGGCGDRGFRWLLPADRNVRHLEPGGHRPVQVRIVEDRRQARVHPERQLLGHQGEAQDADLPPDHRLDGASAGAPVGRARRRQRACAPGRPSRLEQLEPEGAEPARVHRRVRRHEPEGRAPQQPQGPSGGCLRHRQEGRDRRVLRWSWPGGEPVPAADRRGVREEGRAGLLVQPGQGQGAAPGSGSDPAGDAGVLVPDRQAPPVHAGSAADLPGVQRQPREVRLQDRRAPGSVAWRLPVGRPVGPGPALPARLDR